MAKKETNPLIHCEACGESYSATYRRCPFCGNKGSREQEGGYTADEVSREQNAEENRAASRGGKRLAGAATAATPRSGGTTASRSVNSASGSRSAGASRSSGSSRGGGPVPQGRSATPRRRAPQPRRSAFLEFWDRVGISPVRVIGFIFTLIVIIVVFLVVTKLVLPAIGRGSVNTPNNEKDPPGQSEPAEPSPSESPSTKPVEKDPEPTNTIPDDQTAADFRLSLTEFTISARWLNPVKVEATLLPAGSKGTLTWVSSDPNVIGVNQDGTIWATGKGSATVTVTLPGAEPQTIKVISTVAGGVPPATVDPQPSGTTGGTTTGTTTTKPNGKLKLNYEEFMISDKYPNPVTVKVSSGATGAVTWTSSDSAVASVDQNGKVSRVGSGMCTITATDSAGNSATCLVRCGK